MQSIEPRSVHGIVGKELRPAAKFVVLPGPSSVDIRSSIHSVATGIRKNSIENQRKGQGYHHKGCGLPAKSRVSRKPKSETVNGYPWGALSGMVMCYLEASGKKQGRMVSRLSSEADDSQGYLPGKWENRGE